MLTRHPSSTRQGGSTAKTDPQRPHGASTVTPDAGTLPESGKGTPGSTNSGPSPSSIPPRVRRAWHPSPDSGSVSASGVAVDAPSGRGGSAFAVDLLCRVEEECYASICLASWLKLLQYMRERCAPTVVVLTPPNSDFHGHHFSALLSSAFTFTTVASTRVPSKRTRIALDATTDNHA